MTPVLTGFDVLDQLTRVTAAPRIPPRVTLLVGNYRCSRPFVMCRCGSGSASDPVVARFGALDQLNYLGNGPSCVVEGRFPLKMLRGSGVLGG